MGKASRDKGARRERQLVEMFHKLGIHAERVPLSGAMVFRNTRKTDVDVYPFGPHNAPWVCEVKARASGEGFATIKRWLGDADALFLMADRSEPLAVLPFANLVALILAFARSHITAGALLSLVEPEEERIADKMREPEA